jgi:hypothetical protein
LGAGFRVLGWEKAREDAEEVAAAICDARTRVTDCASGKRGAAGGASVGIYGCKGRAIIGYSHDGQTCYCYSFFNLFLDTPNSQIKFNLSKVICSGFVMSLSFSLS